MVVYQKLCGSSRNRILVMLLLSILVVLFASSILIRNKMTDIPFSDIKQRGNTYAKNKLHEELQLDEGMVCEPFSLEVKHFKQKMPKIKRNKKAKCSGHDWVKCNITECRVTAKVLETYTNVVCTYNDIIYESDDNYTIGAPVQVRGAGVYNLTKSDVVKISCTGTRDVLFLNIFPGRWSGVAAAMRPYVLNINEGYGQHINILIFAFDSAARNGFIQRMPKSYEYLTMDLKATILEGMLPSNGGVGDGTSAAWFPILTGKNGWELNTMNMKNKKSNDEMLYMLHNLKAKGYHTLFLEDAPSFSAFLRHFAGFQRKTTEHYISTSLLQNIQDKSSYRKKGKRYCIGDTLQHKLMINLTSQFLQVNGKKFAFILLSDIIHNEVKMTSTTDKVFVDFMKHFKENNFMNDTMLILIGDHGSRYAIMRNTSQGRLEERLPLIGFVFPKRLRATRPEALNTLQRYNVVALSTPHDVHATLLDVLKLPQKIGLAYQTRGKSLFNPISANRSCIEAGIEPHWCECLPWSSVPESDPLHRRATQAFVDFVNFLTKPVRTKCAVRTVSSVSWVMKQRADSRKRSFMEGEQIRLQNYIYQVKVKVDPGNDSFKASLTYSAKEDKFNVDIIDISQSNMYGSEAACISNTHPHLNVYCYCRQN